VTAAPTASQHPDPARHHRICVPEKKVYPSTDISYWTAMDNSVGGTGQGTGQLETVGKQGQVLNWIIRPIEMDKRPDGTWPPMPKINNIVFLDTEGRAADSPANELTAWPPERL
jgi:hypothetical protein